MYIKRHRISRKFVQDFCDIRGLDFIIHKNLGNRKKYWYTYSISENGKRIFDNEKSLRELYFKLVDKYCK